MVDRNFAVSSQKIEVKPLIFWEGFPPCGLLTQIVAEQYGHRLKLLGTRAAVPFEGLEELLGHKIDWLDKPDDIWERREEFADRNFIIHTGWAHPGWLRFDRWMKSRGAAIVVAVDNSWKGTSRQYLGSIWFRLWLKRHFDAAIVPGRSATKLLRFLGMPQNKIFTGYYGAHGSIYKPGSIISARRPEFLYVGQLIHRKGVDILLAAFREYRLSGGTWDLRIIGSGPMKLDCEGDGIIFEGFGQVRHVAQRMAESRCFILPSREDHWGTVVCESMACGTPVISSRWVGASADLIRNGINGWVFYEMTPAALARCMHRMSKMTDSSLVNAQVTALGVAAGYSASSYAAVFRCLTDTLLRTE